MFMQYLSKILNYENSDVLVLSGWLFLSGRLKQFSSRFSPSTDSYFDPRYKYVYMGYGTFVLQCK